MFENLNIPNSLQRKLVLILMWSLHSARAFIPRAGFVRSYQGIIENFFCRTKEYHIVPIAKLFRKRKG